MDELLPYGFHRGGIVASDSIFLHTDTEGFKFGNVVTDRVIACVDDPTGRLYAFRLADYCRRFLNSMRITGLPVEFDAGIPAKAALDVLSANWGGEYRGDVAVRFIAYRGTPKDGPYGVGLAIFALALRPFSQTSVNPPLRGLLSSWMRLPDHVMPMRGMSAAKEANARYARQEATGRGFDEAIMLNHSGKIADFTGASAFFASQGTVITPSMTSDIPVGITRDTCIQLLKKAHSIEVEVREVDSSELFVFDEAWRADSAEGLSPVVEFDGVTVGNGVPGPIFKILKRSFIKCHYPSSTIQGWTQPEGWHTPVPSGSGA